MPPAQPRANKKTGTFGGPAGKKTPKTASPPVSKVYDTATNTFRMKPKGGRIGQATKGSGGHDGSSGPSDGKVGGTGPVDQGDFNNDADTGGTDQQDMTPMGGQVGQATKIKPKPQPHQSGKKIGNPRVK